MKKKSIILWVASLVIVFLAGYISQIIDKDYPITSTFGIEGKKISYRFEKVHYGKNDFEVIIRSDVTNLTGKIFWKTKTENDWNESDLIDSNFVLKGSIPAHKPDEKLLYYIKLSYNGHTFLIPDNQKVELTFYGKISKAIEILRSLLLYIGLILAVRTGLEYFNQNINSKKFGVLTVLVFLLLTVLVNPLYLTYKFGYMNTSIPAIDNLFSTGLVLILILWIVSVITLFTLKRFNYISIISAALTLIIFIVLV
jgi:hypothetical protein